MRMRKSEILRDLITLAFDSDPGDIKISLADALDLYAEVLLNEQPQEKTPPVKRAAREKISTCVNSEAPAEAAEASEEAPTFIGKGSAEKKEIYARLAAYVKDKNPKDFTALEKQGNGAITESEIRDMYSGLKYPMAKWQVLSAALEAVGA